MGKFIIVCLNFPAAGEKLTKIAVTVTGNSFIFFCEIYSILKHSVFWRNLVHIATLYCQDL